MPAVSILSSAPSMRDDQASCVLMWVTEELYTRPSGIDSTSRIEHWSLHGVWTSLGDMICKMDEV